MLISPIGAFPAIARPCGFGLYPVAYGQDRGGPAGPDVESSEPEGPGFAGPKYGTGHYDRRRARPADAQKVISIAPEPSPVSAVSARDPDGFVGAIARVAEDERQPPPV